MIFWLRSFSQKFLNLRMSAGAGYQTRIVERPGLWMSREELDALMGDLRQVASSTLGQGNLSYGVFSGEPERLERSIMTVVYRKQDRAPVAFNALAVMPLDLNGKAIDVLHLGLVMVDPRVRSQGLSWVLYGLTCLLIFLRNQLRPVWLSNVTQVPAIVGMVSETFSHVFPGPGPNTKRSFSHVLIGRQIMAGHRHVFGVGNDAEFDEERFVIRNAYTGGSDDLKKPFDAAPKHRNEIYNAFCRQTLNYERGDDVLQLGQMDLKAASRYLLESVPRGSLLALLASAGLMLLQRLALPLVYWLDAERAWGTLRPWTS